MKLYNSKTNQIELFKPNQPDCVSMYVCGPTVYNYAHLGNARPIVVFDTLKKTLEALGYKVKYVSNYTDIDDKIIKQAQQEGVSEAVIAQKYIDAYQAVREALHSDTPDVCPRVTEVMDEIIEFIQRLIEQGYAYQVGDNVYFRVNKIDHYGSLSKQNLEELIAGSRIDQNMDKENPFDFVVWKKTDDTGIKWDSPWGKGRPGWHTECVVMIGQEFNQPTIDIHGGGMDLKFPHHENESAQHDACCHEPLANYWVHNAMLNIDGQKMSKSLGNVTWAQDLIDVLGSNVVRWLLIQNHYRQMINITDETIHQAQSEIEKIQNGLTQANTLLQIQQVSSDVLNQDVWSKFLEALEDDLNTPNAIVVLFDALKQLNQAIRQREKDWSLIASLFITVIKMTRILGIEFDLVHFSDEDRDLYHQWTSAKQEKNFELADHLRQQLSERGLL